MAIKKSQLYSTLWESCNALRGSMDASQYKDYVLFMLFVKYLSDKAEDPNFHLIVPEGCSFKDFVALKRNNKIGEEIDKKLAKIQEANKEIQGLKIPWFNEEGKFGNASNTKTMVDSLSSLIAVFENPNLDFSHNRAADDDLLGDAYEYLMKNFAAESGKSKGQFYTPAEVSRVMAKMLRIDELDRAGYTIYDPTCGSGSLLLRARAEAKHPKVSLRGQEKDSSTASLAKLNMLLHGVRASDIRIGDTLNEPKFLSGDSLKTFDVCVANPPFSMKSWFHSATYEDPYKRWNENCIPPAKCGDYAFLLHLIHSMKPDEGRGACILPHGVLFRGNAEYEIRKMLITNKYFKGIIGLPPNIFFGTGIPASIIVIDMKDRLERKGIFFIDAKDGFMKDGAKNRLREQDIRRIVDAWEAQQPIEHYCRMVSWDEIVSNDYNLNIPRYIQPRDTEVQHDIEAHLHGGLPTADVDKMDTYWAACPTLKDALLSKKENGYYTLRISKENIGQTIENEISYIKQSEEYNTMLSEWSNATMPLMKAVDKGAHPKELIEVWSTNLLLQTKEHQGLVDAYDAYDVLMNYWNATLQDDCYMIANDGWTIPDVVSEFQDFLEKDIKDLLKKSPRLSYNNVVCDLLPVDVVLREFYTKETKEIEEVEQLIDEKDQQLKELVEQNIELFSFGKKTEETDDETEEAEEVKIPKVKESDVKRAIKNAKKNNLSEAALQTLQQWLNLSAAKEQKSLELKTKRIELTIAVVKKYTAIKSDEAELKRLVVECKWLRTITEGCQALMQSVTHSIASELTTLVERYESTLTDLERSVSDSEAEVNGFLKEMGFTI